MSTTFKHLNLSWKPLLKVCIHNLLTSQPQLETSPQGLYTPPSNTSTSAGNLFSRFVSTTFKHLNLSWKPLLKVCVHHLQTPQPQLETSSQGL